MDQWGARAYFLAAQSLENHSDTPENISDNRNASPENSFPGYEASLGSAFGSLSLRDDQLQPPSFGMTPTSLTPAGGIPMDPTCLYLVGLERDNAAGLVRAQNSVNRVHQNLNVGPLDPWFGQHQQLHYDQDDLRRWNYDVASCNSFSLDPFVHTKEPILNQNVLYNMNGLVPRNSKINNQDLLYNDLVGRVVALSKDQHGSKLLQAKLEKGNKEEIQVVLNEVLDCVGDLMRNQSGSYVVQKLFAVCNEEQRTSIIQAITGNALQFFGICFCQHGARAMQKLLENLSTPQQTSLVISALTPAAVALSNDQSGHHVIQYCVKTFSIEYTRLLLNEIANNCFIIATQKSGCCVLQSCVEFSHGELRDRLITEILTNAVHLSEDQYGNYVVQHLVGLKLPRVTETLIERLQGFFVTLSCNKYASNVVEKIILESGEEHSTRIITELLRSQSASMLLVDPYGNFVIQKALQVSKGPVFQALCKLIYVNSASMQSNIYGKKILDRLFSKKEPLNCARMFKRQV